MAYLEYEKPVYEHRASEFRRLVDQKIPLYLRGRIATISSDEYIELIRDREGIEYKQEMQEEYGSEKAMWILYHRCSKEHYKQISNLVSTYANATAAFPIGVVYSDPYMLELAEQRYPGFSRKDWIRTEGYKFYD